MKKILLTLLLLTTSVFAYEIIDLNEYDNFLKTLNLSKRQAQKIEIIKNEYGPKIANLNAQILLKSMEAAQLRVNPKNYAAVSMLNHESSLLEKELNSLQKEKDKKVLSTLGLIQKYKYRKYISKKH